LDGTAYFLKAIRLKIKVLWEVRPCNEVDTYRHFGGTDCFHHQGRRVNQSS